MTVPSWLRSWAGLALILSAAVGIAGTLTMALEIGHPFGGYISYSIATDDVGKITEETPTWWPIFQLGTEVKGDFYTINGQTYTPNVYAAYERAKPGDEIIIELIREIDGVADQITVPVLLFSLDHFLDLKQAEIIVALSFWLLGLIVLRAAPDHPTNQVFAFLTALITTHRLLNTHTIITDNRLVPNLLEAVLLIAASFLGAAAFHFAWLYPTPIENRPRWLIKLIYIVSAVIAAAMTLGRNPYWPPGIEPPNVVLTTVAYRILLSMYLFGLATIFVRLIFSAFRQNSTRRERRILLVTAFGMLLAMPFLIKSAADIIPGLDPYQYWGNLDLRFLFLAIPLALALAIIRYQNMVMPSRIFVFVAVLGASALLANIAAWIWQRSLLGEPVVQTRLPFLPFFIPIFAGSLFWAVHTSWSGWFGRLMDRDTVNYQATRDLGRRLQGVGDFRELPQSLASAITQEMALTHTAVWVVQSRSGQFELAGQAGKVKTPLPQSLPLPKRPPATNPIRITTPQPAPDWLRPLEEHGGVEIALPLYDDGQPEALLGFGPRWDEEIFDDRDLVVLELIGQQALLYLQVARQIEELRQVPQRVSQAQERERTLLAAELHDTIQQFLGRLPFFLVASKEAMEEDPQEAAELLERSLVDIEEAAVTVQRIRQNLAPSQLDHSLARSLSSLTAHIQQRHGIKTPLTIHGDLDAATTLETRHALYRVIQHALDNVVTHSGADYVAVDLNVKNGRVLFSVADNGRGATEEDIWRAQAMGHFGTQSMQVRIEAVEGEFKLQTTPGEGTCVKGWVPVSLNPPI
jgi:signal transduction histidine kinase